MNKNYKFVINPKKYDGRAKTILLDNKCLFTEKTEKDYIKEGYQVLTEVEYTKIHEEYLNSLCGNWQEITEDEYNEMLNILPPVDWKNGGFFIGERYMDDVTAFYQQWRDKYYTSYQRLSYPRQQIIDSLMNYIGK